MTAPQEITPELRAAVYAADCGAKGHIVGARWGADPTGDADTMPGRSELNDELPYVYCHRCGRVWIIVPYAGADYADAEQRALARVRPDDPLAQAIHDKRSARADRGGQPNQPGPRW